MSDPRDKEIKVTDKRMFTPDGELRDDFREPDGAGFDAPPPAPAAAEAPDAAPASPAAAPPSSAAAAPPQSAAAGPPAGEGMRSPVFHDLVSVLAEPVAIFLGEIEMPEGGPEPNLPMARLYIDLLEILRDKTAGNLAADEKAFLDGLLYQLRMRYVQKTE